MNIKKALASVLTLALLAGCTGGNSTCLLYTSVKARMRDKGTRGLSSIHLFTKRDTSTFVLPAPAEAETTIPIPEELQATDCSADN